jgi:hypothetical protein
MTSTCLPLYHFVDNDNPANSGSRRAASPARTAPRNERRKR